MTVSIGLEHKDICKAAFFYSSNCVMCAETSIKYDSVHSDAGTFEDGNDLL